MNSNAYRTLFLAVSLVLVACGGIYLYGRSEPPRLTVLTSRGTAGVVGGSVFLPGDAVVTGNRLRVGSAPLYLELGTGPKSRMRFGENSVFRHRGRPLGAKSTAFEIERGGGFLHVTDGSVVLEFSGVTFLVENGPLRWRLEPDRTVTRDDSTRLRVVRKGETLPVNKTDITVPEASLRLDWPANPHPLENYEQYSTIRQAESVLESLVGRSQAGRPPESLLEAFGHWVRDRWGNVYRYTIDGDRLILRSGGPDERLFTEDDRRWSARVTR